MFKQADWPLHLTIVPVFYSDEINGAEIAEKTELCTHRSPIEVLGKSREMFGYNKDVSVTEMVRTEELRSLHAALVQTLQPTVRFRSPQFIDNGYRPHVTDQSEASIRPGDSVLLDSLSLVKLKVNSMRTILRTFYLMQVT